MEFYAAASVAQLQFVEPGKRRARERKRGTSGFPLVSIWRADNAILDNASDYLDEIQRRNGNDNG